LSVLSDVRIIGKILDKEIKISPFIIDHVQAASIDLTLDNKIKVPIGGKSISVYDNLDDHYEEESFEDKKLKPGEMVLAQVKETISLPNSLNGTIQNRNSLVRMGINVGLSSYINPGYSGQLGIVIHNMGKFEVDLVPGMRICQLILNEVKPEAHRDYSQRHDSKYNNETGIQTPKLYQDREFADFLESDNVKKAGFVKQDLVAFLENRVKAESKKIIDGLTDEEMRLVGLKK